MPPFVRSSVSPASPSLGFVSLPAVPLTVRFRPVASRSFVAVPKAASRPTVSRPACQTYSWYSIQYTATPDTDT
jgi:hypothetical protein